MSFLSPLTALLAASLAIPALVALYFLKLKRKKVEVPTTLLWQRAVHDLQVNTPFQRIRNSWMLWLQLLLLIALLLAMAQPVLDRPAEAGSRTVIVIDRSASMNVQDAVGVGGVDGSTKSRLAAAKEAALAIIDGLEDSLGADANGGDGSSSGGGVMIVAFAERAVTVQAFTNDVGRLREAVRGIEATDQRSRFASAMGLVEPFTLGDQGGAGAVRVHVLSDGRHHAGAEPAALGSAEVLYTRLGGGEVLAEGASGGFADNVGLIAMSARRGLEAAERVQVYARLANYGAEPVTTNVSLRLDGRPVTGAVRSVTVPPAGAVSADGVHGEPGSAQVQFDFQWTGSALIEVKHGHDDALSADNAAAMVLAPARRLRVLVVTAGNPYLIAGVRAARPAALVTMSPAEYDGLDPATLARGGWAAGDDADGEGVGFDVVIFDGHVPGVVPPVSSLSFGVVPPIEGLKVRPSPEGSPGAEYLLQWRRDHALMRNVELADVVLRRPGRLVVPSGATVLATATAGPVMAEVRRDGLRHVVASFGVLETDWPLFVSFPTFFQNALTTLSLGGLTGEAGIVYRTGENARLSGVSGGVGVETLRYGGPAELVGTVTAAAGGDATADGLSAGGVAVLPAFPRVGVYTSEDELDPPWDRLPVNLLDPLESDVRPAGAITVGAMAVEGTSGEAVVQREVWPWLVWGALGLLLVEWVVYSWRMRV
ncbi:MAG: VWA domain-containing protein [Planctomycetota bacterium]